MTTRETPKAPTFKLMLVDAGSWVIAKPQAIRQDGNFGGGSVADVRKAFKDYHGRAPSRKARLYVVPESYGIEEDGMTFSVKPGEFAPVEVR